MSTNNFFRSDLPRIYNVVQNTMLVFPKEIVISTLREYFAKDTYYHFAVDEWGFPKTPDHTDLPATAGLDPDDSTTTRLFIGEQFRRDTSFYPALIVRHGGANSVPISMNREQSSVQWGKLVFEDGYGNIKTFNTPEHFILSGAWEGSINIDVLSRSLRARDDLSELVSILFVDLEFANLERSGLIIKSVQAGSTSEQDDRSDKLFRQTITLNVRSEWRRAIPVGNIVEVIQTSVEFGRTEEPVTPIAANLTINSTQTLVEILESL